jgi:hypothetical protein
MRHRVEVDLATVVPVAFDDKDYADTSRFSR